MKRFTAHLINGTTEFVLPLCENCPEKGDDCQKQCYQVAMCLLAAYEDTGLIPEEIEKLKCKTDITPTNGKHTDYVHYDYDTIEEATEI